MQSSDVDPRRGGWRAVMGAFVGFMLSYATLGVMVLSLLTEPLSSEFDWDRSVLSNASMIFVVTAVTLSLPLGMLMDHTGVRPVLLPSIGAFGLVLASMCFLSASSLHMYAAYFLLGVAAAATLPNSYTRIIVGWFDRNRGRALGIAATGAAVGMVLLPPVLARVLLTYGWQGVYLVSAALMLIVCLPFVGILLKENTYRLDTAQSPTVVATTELSRAMRSGSFWVLALAYLLLGFGTIGVVPHLIPMVEDMGLGTMLAAYVLSAYGVAAIAGRLGCGVLLDVFPTPRVAILFAACPLAACVILGLGQDVSAGLAAAVLVGVAAGAELDLMPFMISRYLGTAAFAQIYAVIFAGFYVAGGVGTAMLGYQFVQHGTYSPGLWLMVAVIALALFLLANERWYRAPSTAIAIKAARLQPFEHD